jgi:hypothetical protein
MAWIPLGERLALRKFPDVRQAGVSLGTLLLPLDFRHNMLFNRSGVAVPQQTQRKIKMAAYRPVHFAS